MTAADPPRKTAEETRDAPPEKPDVLSNALQRTDNDFNGVENDETLIGHDLPDDEDDDLDEIDRRDASGRSRGERTSG